MHRKILIADDNLTLRKQWHQLLQEQGYEVISVGNGELALTKLQEFQPHMVMLDVIMPGKTGYEVCDYMKSEPDLNQIPVILTFSENEPFDIAEARRVGATRCIPKMIEAEQLISILDFIWAGVTPIEYAQNLTTIDEPVFETQLDEPEIDVEPISDGEEVSEMDEDTPQYLFEVKVEDSAPSAPEEDLSPMPAMQIHADNHEVEIPGLDVAVKQTAAQHSITEPHITEPLITEPLTSPSSTNNHSIEAADQVLESSLSEEPFKFQPQVEDENTDDLLQIKAELISKKCPECRARVVIGDVFCIECGAALDEAVIKPRKDLSCEQCGQELHSGDVFCLNCGAVQ
jgi:CheY-like chemotaxis protein